MDTRFDTGDRDTPYTLTGSDATGILSSTRLVMERSSHVRINFGQVERLCERWQAEGWKNRVDAPPWDTHYHFHDGTERTVNWLLVLDALNFCFWSEKGQPRWTIDYQGERLDGYWAEAAALKRSVEEGLPLWDAEFLSTISEEAMAHIFRGQRIIPLFEQRIANAREVGRVLLERYDGRFARVIEEAGGSAVRLALLLAEQFSSFNDVATYRQHTIRFLKRAQICAADVHNAFAGQQWGTFTDYDQLTAFADYKLPQILRHQKVLEYDAELARRIDNQELIAAGSEEEVEIRAATIWACELLRREVQRRGYQANAADIDQQLWVAAQNTASMLPYHRTRTLYY